MTTDKAWAAMTPRQQDAMVAVVVFGRTTCLVDGQILMASGRDEGWQGIPNYASSWPGLGFVVERMRELGFSVVIANDKANWARFLKVLDMWKYAVGEAESDSIPSATALAAVRAIQEAAL